MNQPNNQNPRPPTGYLIALAALVVIAVIGTVLLLTA